MFSKTSFQYKKISPEHPRALYFNDDVYVGQVHDGKAIEVVSFDPMQGAIFYLLDEHKTDACPGSNVPSWIALSATSRPRQPVACQAFFCAQSLPRRLEPRRRARSRSSRIRRVLSRTALGRMVRHRQV